MKLSILILSLHDRHAFLTRLLGILSLQNKECLDKTEILINLDNRKKTVGKKRNELLAMAKGEYVVFIDDDDTISDDYLLRVFEGINYGVDHIGITMLYQPDKGSHGVVKCSKDYAWRQAGNTYYRSVQHVCPIKTDIARRFSYPEINFGEDKYYAHAVTPFIKTEHLIDTPIYFYLDRINKTV